MQNYSVSSFGLSENRGKFAFSYDRSISLKTAISMKLDIDSLRFDVSSRKVELLSFDERKTKYREVPLSLLDMGMSLDTSCSNLV